MKRGHRTGKPKGGYPHLYGRHAVTAALANPHRVIRKIWGTRDAINALELPPVLPIVYSDVADLGRMVPHDAPHQGIVAEVEPLEDIWLGDLLEQGAADDQARKPILVLDQVTDPHNVGAILRSAAAFGAAGVIVTDRHAPSDTGVLAKAASGALEVVPLVRAVNLARALDQLREANFWRYGLDERGEAALNSLDLRGRACIVLGAEGEGLRRLTAEKCDRLITIPTSAALAALNVSNAAAVATYEWARQRQSA